MSVVDRCHNLPQADCQSQSRLAVNSVTLGDYARPLQIGNFIKDLFAGFQLLNLKNDILRKRSDGIKYSVSRDTKGDLGIVLAAADFLAWTG